MAKKVSGSCIVRQTRGSNEDRRKAIEQREQRAAGASRRGGGRNKGGGGFWRTTGMPTSRLGRRSRDRCMRVERGYADGDGGPGDGGTVRGPVGGREVVITVNDYVITPVEKKNFFGS